MGKKKILLLCTVSMSDRSGQTKCRTPCFACWCRNFIIQSPSLSASVTLTYIKSVHIVNCIEVLYLYVNVLSVFCCNSYIMLNIWQVTDNNLPVKLGSNYGIPSPLENFDGDLNSLAASINCYVVCIASAH